MHGDLNSGNIIFSGDEIYLIDFADAVYAPLVYEHGHIASELFEFDKGFLKGYFGEYDIDDLLKTCLTALLIHDFGGDIVNDKIAKSTEIKSVDDLRQRIYWKLSCQ